MHEATHSAGDLVIRRLGNYERLLPEEEAAIRQMLALPVRFAPARRDLIAEGAPPRAVFLIVSGWASQFKTLEDGRRQIVGFLLPGDTCDLSNLVLARMDHSIGALTDVRYLEIPGEALQRLAAEHPRIGKALWWQMLVNLSVQREWTTNLGQRNALERLGSLLCELVLRMRATRLIQGDSYELPLTQIDRADATGLTSVHVNRTLQQMRTSGLISLSGRVLRIPSFAALQEASLFTSDYLHHGTTDHCPTAGVLPRSDGTDHAPR